MGALMFAKSLFVHKHSTAPSVIALKEHFVYMLFVVLLELADSDTRSKLLTKLTIIKRRKGQAQARNERQKAATFWSRTFPDCEERSALAQKWFKRPLNGF